MRKILILFSLLFVYSSVDASIHDVVVADTISAAHADVDKPVKKPSFIKRVGRGIKSIIDEFTTYDTTYIEPQHYKFQIMGQMVSRFDNYTLKTNGGDVIEMAPETTTTFGPYAGYSLIFLGYTLQLNNLYINTKYNAFNMSIYTSLFGADFYYNQNDHLNIRRLSLSTPTGDDKYDTMELIGMEFDGMSVEHWGFNTYYIPNHRKHAYPAAYNQSTCQKISSGSMLVGFGYSKFNLNMDWKKFDEFFKEYLSDYERKLAEEALPKNIVYDSYSLYGGYSYNWAFARNWLLGASATLAVNYKKSNAESYRDNHLYDDFKASNLSLGGIGRMGLVWNNTRYFAGASAQIHSYSYGKKQFYINNTFGTFNVYFGLNIGKKKAYRKPGKFFEF